MTSKPPASAHKPQLMPKPNAIGAAIRQASASDHQRVRSHTVFKRTAPIGPSCSFRLGGESVTRTAHRLDQAIVAGRFERSAQAAYMYIYGPLLDEDVVAPNLVE